MAEAVASGRRWLRKRRGAHNRTGNHLLAPAEDRTLCGRPVGRTWKLGWFDGRLYYCDKCFKPRPEPPSIGGAWVAPDGTFYPTDYASHTSDARRLGDATGGRALEEQGWLHVIDNGEAFKWDGHRRVPFTQPQLDVLGKLLELAQAEGAGPYAENILTSLRRSRDDG